MPDQNERAGFLSRVQETWRQTVGKFATDEGETKTLFNRLSELGTVSRDEATRLVQEVRGRIEDNRKELDRRIDESVKTATKRLSLPSRAEIEALDQKLASMTERLAKLESRR